MPSTHIVRQSSIVKTARVIQCQSLFDIPPSETSEVSWNVNFELPQEWNVGLIVGPSGAGKSTVAKELFGDCFAQDWQWSSNQSLLDGFPKHMGIKEITEMLSSVGFSSPPAWMKSHHVLSNGEQFRVNMARTLAEMPDMCVVDEFTSVVDRTVAQIGSHAIGKAVRKRNQKFVAVTCHYDVAEWLEPDWIYQPHTGEFISGRLLRRPEITLKIKRVKYTAWELFRKHHYLNTSINPAAGCFCAYWNDIPVAFTSVLYFTHPKVKAYREHRTVCLPDYQGVGIGNALSAYVASLYASKYRYFSTTGNPAMIRHRNKSSLWAMTSAPKMNSKQGKTTTKPDLSNAGNRFVAGFAYAGASNEKDARGFGII